MEYLHKNFLNSDSLNGNKVHAKKQKNYNFKEVSKLTKRAKVAEKKREEEEESEEESEEDVLAGNNTVYKALNATETPGLNPNTTARAHTTTPILESWFMISSKGFLDQNRFPP